MLKKIRQWLKGDSERRELEREIKLMQLRKQVASLYLEIKDINYVEDKEPETPAGTEEEKQIKRLEFDLRIAQLKTQIDSTKRSKKGLIASGESKWKKVSMTPPM